MNIKFPTKLANIKVNGKRVQDKELEKLDQEWLTKTCLSWCFEIAS